jgi:hypothetical protein
LINVFRRRTDLGLRYRPVTFFIVSSLLRGNDLVVRSVSKVVRGWIIVAALAQALLPGVISVVDASAAGDAATAAVRPHVESHGTPKCPRVHQEDKCALCQFVGAALALSATAAPLALPSSGLAGLTGTREQSPVRPTAGDPSLPRAPPALA